MDAAVANLGWTEDHWNRICSTVVEEAQKARVAAQALPSTGPEDKSVVAVPRYEVTTAGGELEANSDPDLYLTRISVNVALRSHEIADHQLGAALQMFRRAANVIARAEDALVFYGRRSTTLNPVKSAFNYLAPGLPAIFSFTDDTHNVHGIFQWLVGPTALGDPGLPLKRGIARRPDPVEKQFRAGLTAKEKGGSLGDGAVNTIVAAITAIEANGFYGPFACCLGRTLFEAICTPAPSLVLPRDRILPFLQGPLLRASALHPDDGVVIALAGNPVELVVASEIHVRFLQVNESGHALFRVSERVAVRIKNPGAIQRIRS